MDDLKLELALGIREESISGEYNAKLTARIAEHLAVISELQNTFENDIEAIVARHEKERAAQREIRNKELGSAMDQIRATIDEALTGIEKRVSEAPGAAAPDYIANSRTTPTQPHIVGPDSVDPVDAVFPKLEPFKFGRPLSD